MKVLYIGDNRNRGNFGCRGTSTALSMLIRKNNEITGVISGRYTDRRNDYLFYYSFLPAWAYTFLGKHNTIKLLFERIVNKIGIKKTDFVTLDLAQSIENLKKCIPSNLMLEELNLENYDFDAIVINGEGSFIFMTPTWREPLILSMLIYWAKSMGKKVFFMNAMFSDDSITPHNTDFVQIVDNLLSSCECVVVREKQSYDYAKKFLPHIKPVIIPDALFSWFPYINDNHLINNYRYYITHIAEEDKLYDMIDFSFPYILVAASSSGLVSNRSKAIPVYADLVRRVKDKLNLNVFLIQTCDGDAFLNEVSSLTNTPIISMETPLLAVAKILANAACFISGRYHPAVMASQGGTPCVFMTSNSHKTRSIQLLLDYDFVKEFSALPNSSEIDEMIVTANIYISKGKVLRDKIRCRAKELFEQSLEIAEFIQ